MSQGPGGELGRIVESIMAEIKPHLLPDGPGTAGHYNLAYEAVARGISEFGETVARTIGETFIRHSADFRKWEQPTQIPKD